MFGKTFILLIGGLNKIFVVVSVCGKSYRNMRVVGGNEANAHEFPWLVGLTNNGEFICGASLITRSHLLTAAHCIHG